MDEIPAAPGNPYLSLLLRILMYGLWLVLLTQLLMWDARAVGEEVKFMEDTYTEWTQQTCLLLMSIIFATGAFRYGNYRALSILLLGCSLIGLVREFNNYFNNRVFDGAWQLLAGLVLVAILALFWKHREAFRAQLLQFISSLSFGLLLAGFLTTFVFSRLYGRTTFWETVMEERYFRSVKNAGEEGAELLGYGLLLMAAVEFYLFLQQKKSASIS